MADAGFAPTGSGSPWGFGSKTGDEYRYAIAASLKAVSGIDHGWYACAKWDNPPALFEPIDGFKLVGVKATIPDKVWDALLSPRTDPEFISEIADVYITDDGKEGLAVDLIKEEKPVVMLVHWQSMFSNGTRSGLRAFELICQRLNRHYGEVIEWQTLMEFSKKRFPEF